MDLRISLHRTWQHWCINEQSAVCSKLRYFFYQCPFEEIRRAVEKLCPNVNVTNSIPGTVILCLCQRKYIFMLKPIICKLRFFLVMLLLVFYHRFFLHRLHL
jgi:hypothetical protein